jgi:hypothetical protein
VVLINLLLQTGVMRNIPHHPGGGEGSAKSVVSTTTEEARHS